ncbi:hypothetical protein [Anaerovibrio sp.]|uniref:hypothetical protein n=1 Tax=Anaerovibrio sp. TaxID=1872532 RepID=UPI003890D962
MPATLNEAPQIYRAEFSDAHSTKAVALAFACRCNDIDAWMERNQMFQCRKQH